LAPSSASVTGDDFSWTYDVTMPPGSTVCLLHVAAQNPDRKAALKKVESLLSLEWLSRVEIPPALAESVANFPLAEGDLFIRGDANSSGRVDLSDGVFILNYLFLAGPEPEVMDAADATDDGRIDISDPIRVLLYLFQGGLPPPHPFPEPGRDFTYDEL
ncbi:MAG: hypothetical protein JXA90_15655, partial [Planctomycetes bacterium]|nr:hypothetical protein [Planctomycetota bacterium]